MLRIETIAKNFKIFWSLQVRTCVYAYRTLRAWWWYAKYHFIGCFFCCFMFNNVLFVSSFPYYLTPMIWTFFFFLQIFLMFCFTVCQWLFLSTEPWVVGFLAAPWSWAMPLFLQNWDIREFLNSRPLSVCIFWGNPNCQRSWDRHCNASSACLFFNG